MQDDNYVYKKRSRLVAADGGDYAASGQPGSFRTDYEAFFEAR